MVFIFFGLDQAAHRHFMPDDSAKRAPSVNLEYYSARNCGNIDRLDRPLLFDACRYVQMNRLRGIHHGVSPQHLLTYLNEFTFRFNRRFCPFNAFRSLLGIAGDITAPTYAGLYAKKSRATSGRV